MDYEREVVNLETMLRDMEADFAECARTGKSQCFFCANDDTCDGCNCNFKWKPHNSVGGRQHEQYY